MDQVFAENATPVAARNCRCVGLAGGCTPLKPKLRQLVDGPPSSGDDSESDSALLPNQGGGWRQLLDAGPYRRRPGKLIANSVVLPAAPIKRKDGEVGCFCWSPGWAGHFRSASARKCVWKRITSLCSGRQCM